MVASPARLLVSGLLLMAATAVVSVIVDRADAGNFTYTVTNVDDPGDGSCDASCSLRDAITLANANPNHTIAFDIPGCPSACTIATVSELPAITADGTTIDGTTEPDYAGTPIVTIDGDLTTGAAGIMAFASNVVIKGLVIENFDGMGVHGATFTEFDGRRVESNVIRDNGQQGVGFNGSDVSVIDNIIDGNGDAGVGANYAGAGTGLLIHGNEITDNGYYGVAYSFIDTTITDNLISGNDEAGIQSAGGSGGTTIVTGNTITNNANYGMIVTEDFVEISDNTVTGNAGIGVLAGGGPGTVTGNQIRNNGFVGPFAPSGDGPSPGLQLGGQGAKVATGNEITGNASHGVEVTSSGHTIGGTSPDDANLISGNGGSGVFVEVVAQGNSILGNSIYDNGGLGIDLDPLGVTEPDPLDVDTGANNLQNFPVLATAISGSVTVTGEFNSHAETDFRIEFFRNDVCDASQFGEGQTPIGFQNVATDVAGNAVIQAFLADAPPGGFITATATNQTTGDTSEFSNCIPIASPATPTPSPSPSTTATSTPTATPTPTPTPTASGSATPSPTAVGEQIAWGDNNCSGPPPDPVDSLLTLRFDAGLSTNTGDCPPMGEVVEVGEASPHPWGDIDCSGEVNPVDSLKLLRFDAGLPVDQPVGCPELGATVSVVG